MKILKGCSLGGGNKEAGAKRVLEKLALGDRLPNERVEKKGLSEKSHRRRTIKPHLGADSRIKGT